MLTLFTKVIRPEKATPDLLHNFGYKQRPKGQRPGKGNFVDVFDCPDRQKELHCTMTSLAPNSLGLVLRTDGPRLTISNERGIDVEAHHDEDYLREAFEKKYSHSLIYVLADNERINRSTEKFWFNEARLLSGFSFTGFSELVNKGVVKVDLRLGHYPDGRPHDHGTGFRVYPRDLARCFTTIERIV